MKMNEAKPLNLEETKKSWEAYKQVMGFPPSWLKFKYGKNRSDKDAR